MKVTFAFFLLQETDKAYRMFVPSGSAWFPKSQIVVELAVIDVGVGSPLFKVRDGAKVQELALHFVTMPVWLAQKHWSQRTIDSALKYARDKMPAPQPE